MADTPPLRRSMLYLAGAYPQMLDAYPSFPADMFCFDLEDGTPPHDKLAARERIADALRTIPDGAGRERLLRVHEAPVGVVGRVVFDADGVEGRVAVQQLDVVHW